MHRIALVHALMRTIAIKRGESNQKIFKRKQKEHTIEPFRNGNIEDFILLQVTPKKTIQEIFLLMQSMDFDSYPSINKTFDVHLKEAFTQYDLLQEIDLYTHTLNVTVEILELTKGHPSFIKSIAVLTALFHDMGKHPEIFTQYGMNTRKHEIASANFAKYLLTSLTLKHLDLAENVITTVINTVENHHTPEYTVKDTFVRMLKTADRNARQKELLHIMQIKGSDNDS